MSHYPTHLVCPHCLVETDCVMPLLEEQGPKPGDRSVCPYCAKVSIFTVGLTLRRATPDEVSDAMDDPVIERAVTVVQRSLRGR